MCILCIHVKINKCSFEPFCVWILFTLLIHFLWLGWKPGWVSGCGKCNIQQHWMFAWRVHQRQWMLWVLPSCQNVIYFCLHVSVCMYSIWSVCVCVCVGGGYACSVCVCVQYACSGGGGGAGAVGNSAAHCKIKHKHCYIFLFLGGGVYSFLLLLFFFF